MLTVHDIDVYVKHLKDIATHLFLLFLIRYFYLKLIYRLQCKVKKKKKQIKWFIMREL